MSGLVCLIQFYGTRPLLSPPPVCHNCVHVIRGSWGSVCSLNGRFDPVTGKITHTACSVARTNDTMCGYDGRFFVHYLSIDQNLTPP